MVLFNRRRKHISDLGFYPIPIFRFKERYWIDDRGTILEVFLDEKSHPDMEAQFLYKRDEFDPASDEELKPLTFSCGDDETLELTPMRLYLLTFYGYLPGNCRRVSVDAPVKRRYIYEVYRVQNEDGSITLNDMEFRKSPRYNVYAAKSGGCIFDGRTILSHQIDKTGHHLVNLKRGGKIRSTGVHRIIYDAWKGIQNPDHVIHHVDDYPWHNNIDNLVELSYEEHEELHRKSGKRNYVYSNETIDEVCRLMSEGVRPVEAARRVGIDPNSAVRLRSGQRGSISGNYIYPELDRFRRTRLTTEEVHQICRLFEENQLSNSQISKQFDCSPETIRDIREGRTWKHISSEYEFNPDNPGGHPGAKGMRNTAKITEEEVVRVYDLLCSGVPPKRVSEITGVSYTTVKKIKYKIRWVELTDRLDVQYANDEEGSTTIERIAREKNSSE